MPCGGLPCGGLPCGALPALGRVIPCFFKQVVSAAKLLEAGGPAAFVVVDLDAVAVVELLVDPPPHAAKATPTVTRELARSPFCAVPGMDGEDWSVHEVPLVVCVALSKRWCTAVRPSARRPSARQPSAPARDVPPEGARETARASDGDRLCGDVAPCFLGADHRYGFAPGWILATLCLIVFETLVPFVVFTFTVLPSASVT